MLISCSHCQASHYIDDQAIPLYKSAFIQCHQCLTKITLPKKAITPEEAYERATYVPRHDTSEKKKTVSKETLRSFFLDPTLDTIPFTTKSLPNEDLPAIISELDITDVKKELPSTSEVSTSEGLEEKPLSTTISLENEYALETLKRKRKHTIIFLFFFLILFSVLIGWSLSYVNEYFHFSSNSFLGRILDYVASF